MIKYICEDCGYPFLDRESADSHSCDHPTTTLPNGLEMCNACWTPAPCRTHQPRAYAEARNDPPRERCPVHDMPDCSPLLNGCSRLTAPHGYGGDAA
jgi:hypothetical protein